MKHKHYDMIVAKAANMKLVVFFNPSFGSGCGKWEEATTTLFPAFHPGTEYFLCLPKHKEAVLNCLNGGVSEVFGGSGNFDRGDAVIGSGWSSCSLLWYMNDACESRIKPKKEKRWILVNHETNCTSMLYDDEQIALGALQEEFLSWQIIEIEVEA